MDLFVERAFLLELKTVNALNDAPLRPLDPRAGCDPAVTAKRPPCSFARVLISASGPWEIEHVTHGRRTTRTHLRASICIAFLHLRQSLSCPAVTQTPNADRGRTRPQPRRATTGAYSIGQNHCVWAPGSRTAKPTRSYDDEHHAAADHANPNALQTGHRLSCINATHRPHA